MFTMSGMFLPPDPNGEKKGMIAMALTKRVRKTSRCAHHDTGEIHQLLRFKWVQPAAGI